jgi:ligand-binding sensor domain-containing protein
MNGFRKKYQIVLMICCFAGINHLYSQFKKENQQFKFFVQVDGLSSLHTRQSVMDHYGFLWIATQDGLNRYDGKRFTIYNKYNNNPFSVY